MPKSAFETGIRAGIRRLFRHRPRSAERVAADVDDEIALHIELREEQLIRRGMPPDVARVQAIELFGSVDHARHSLRQSVTRREDRLQMRELLEALGQDFRYAVRGMRNQPAFTAAVVFVLALGIGANATMFGIVDRLLLRPPAYLQAPGETGRVYLIRTFDGDERPATNIQYRRYLDLRENTRAFSQMAAFFNVELVFGTGEEARQTQASMVSASFWPFFGVRPALGRFFTEEEDKVPAGTPVAVLGYGYWQSRFAGDRAVLGRQLRIGGTDYTIIGVAPQGFSGMSLSAVAAFIPITTGAADLFSDARRLREPWYDTYRLTWMEMIARRAPGVSAEAATADLTNAFRQSLEAERARAPERMAPIAESRPKALFASILRDRGPDAGQNARVSTWLAGVALLVLLIACANVANLLLARAMQRRREVAVRLALGVSRGRLLAQLLTESVLLAAVAAIGGLLMARWGGGILRAALLPDVEWTNAAFDVRTLLFAGVAAAVAGVLIGVAPARLVRQSDVVGALKAGGREGSLHRSRLRLGLLIFQSAISVMLLVGAGLFVRSLRNVRTLDLGFEPERLLFINLEMRGTKLDSAQRVSLIERLMERADALPMVESSTQTMMVPFMMRWSEDIRVPGIDSTQLRDEYSLNAVSPAYFTTMGTRIIRGRGVSADDRAGTERVVILSETAARTIWPTADPIGKCVKIGGDTVPCSTVVGIAQDIRARFDEAAARHIYLPAKQSRESNGIFVRTRGEARKHAESVRRELQRLMPGASFVSAQPLQDIVDPEIRPWRLGAIMFTLFGVLALVVAAVGLYSVIAYGVTQRMHELGVRVALGARDADVIRLVVGEGARVAAVGVALGIAVALLAGRFLAPLLFEVSPKDPATLIGVSVMLLLVAVLASLIPALRAAHVDPNVALRAD